MNEKEQKVMNLTDEVEDLVINAVRFMDSEEILDLAKQVLFPCEKIKQLEISLKELETWLDKPIKKC